MGFECNGIQMVSVNVNETYVVINHCSISQLVFDAPVAQIDVRLTGGAAVAMHAPHQLPSAIGLRRNKLEILYIVDQHIWIVARKFL